MIDVVNLMAWQVENNILEAGRAEGSVRKHGDSFIIYVSPFQTKERLQFTIAHELGH